ncbi:MAG: hypothetical protein IT379_36900 [Deltaproteobacteria bacterium]|nr:hypothetical protein [Deltaproteobacteria bacterium]
MRGELDVGPPLPERGEGWGEGPALVDPEPVAWVLNLDADLELAKPNRYAPTAASRRMNAAFRSVASALLGPFDVVLEEGDRLPDRLRGMAGRAFCPTPRARRLLREAGAAPEPAPELAVLRAVNSRAFCAALGERSLPDCAFVEDLESALRLLSRRSPTDRWLAKRAFGFAGKGQRRFSSSPSAADLAWVRASMAAGGLQIEPFVEVALEVALHGHVDASGACRRGKPCVQTCDAFGTWRHSRVAEPGEIGDAEQEALRSAFDETAVALANAGYFGPFGIDAFRWRAPDGALRFRPRSEINARFTMGYPVGMQDRSRSRSRRHPNGT